MSVQSEIRPSWRNRDLEFKVIKDQSQTRNNVVLSRRAVVEKEYSAEREELLKTLEERCNCYWALLKT